MDKILDKSEVIKTVNDYRSNNKSVGLITGCFDLLHKGHINLFRFAKSKVNLLIIGVDGDDNVNRLKGDNRPINSIEARMFVLSELENVDYVFAINDIIPYNTPEADDYFRKLYKDILPNMLFTTPAFDRYFSNKEKLCISLDIHIVPMTDNLYIKPKVSVIRDK